MMKRVFLLLVVVGIAACTLRAQLRTVSVVRLPVDGSARWSEPKFSPDGTRVFFTTQEYVGIWELSLRDSSIRQITADPGAGYGYEITSDGENIIYRRTENRPELFERRQELVVQNLSGGSGRVAASGSNVALSKSPDGMMATLAEPQRIAPVLLGIEDTKIALLRNGTKQLFDPIPGGSYIWPSLSPDGTALLAYEMRRGTFVCDIDGTVRTKLGRRDAPVWTRDGRWIVYMNDRDDGHRILGSDIMSLSSNGGEAVNLTNGIVEGGMFPHCSPTDNAIVFNTIQGELYLLRYEERR